MLLCTIGYKDLYSKDGHKNRPKYVSAMGFTFSHSVLRVQELHAQAKCVPLGSFLVTHRSACEGPILFEC